MDRGAASGREGRRGQLSAEIQEQSFPAVAGGYSCPRWQRAERREKPVNESSWPLQEQEGESSWASQCSHAWSPQEEVGERSWSGRTWTWSPEDVDSWWSGGWNPQEAAAQENSWPQGAHWSMNDFSAGSSNSLSSGDGLPVYLENAAEASNAEQAAAAGLPVDLDNAAEARNAEQAMPLLTAPGASASSSAILSESGIQTFVPNTPPTASTGRKYLEPLLGQWVSLKYGMVTVSSGSSSGEPLEDTLEVLHVDGEVLGTISVERFPAMSSDRPQPDKIILARRQSDVEPLVLKACNSNRKFVRWGSRADVRAEFVDAWTACLNMKELIAAAFDGKARVEELGLDPHVDERLLPLWPPLVATQTLPPSEPRKRVALCTGTKNRLYQLRHSLPLNLVHLWPHRGWVRYYIVDFDSNDGTADFILQNCKAALEAGLLLFYQAEGTPYWHASTCKNAVHILADEEILVNVDGDNLVGPDFPVDVLDQFEAGNGVLQYETGEGTCGRIAYLREDFLFLNGYDEDAFPMGAQDTDIIMRLRSIGRKLKRIKDPKWSQAITNTNDAKVANVDPKYGVLKWGRMDGFNRQLFQWRRSLNMVQRNTHRGEIGMPVIRVGGGSLRGDPLVR